MRAIVASATKPADTAIERSPALVTRSSLRMMPTTEVTSAMRTKTSAAASDGRPSPARLTSNSSGLGFELRGALRQYFLCCERVAVVRTLGDYFGSRSEGVREGGRGADLD